MRGVKKGAVKLRVKGGRGRISNLTIFLRCIIILGICFKNVVRVERRHVRGSINKRVCHNPA